jgi:PAS domain S-box-containing protein
MSTEAKRNLQDTAPATLINILAVDDKPANLIAVEAALDGLGQNLVKAQSGEEALKHVLDTDFALILLDVQMPGMDGFETAALIRQRERGRHVPIVFLTAAYQFDSMRGYSLGAVDYLLKPLVPGILKAKVAIFIDLFKRAEQIRLQEQTLRERAEKALSASQANYRLLFDNNPRPMWVYDTDTFGFLAVNDAAVEKYGYPREEFLTMTIKDIRRPEDLDSLLETLAKIPASSENSGSLRHRTKTGSLIEVEIASHDLPFRGRRARGCSHPQPVPCADD